MIIQVWLVYLPIGGYNEWYFDFSDCGNNTGIGIRYHRCGGIIMGLEDMFIKKVKANRAVIIIPEIYGINDYVKNMAAFFNNQGYDAYCLNLIRRDRIFAYSEEAAAYVNFRTKIGFDRYHEVAVFMEKLQGKYQSIIVFGSSVGATIAWRLTDNPACKGMIGYYGSRIRDYLEVNPGCPCLLLFAAEEKSFDINTMLPQLELKENIKVAVMPGQHGFADPYAGHFHVESGKKALDMVEWFLEDINH
ncbi:dienelactone hydrolase family protein [Acetobacterium bakii]|nr:dienelactone hydrolase family protein [Acetobacterium bakii]